MNFGSTKILLLAFQLFDFRELSVGCRLIFFTLYFCHHVTEWTKAVNSLQYESCADWGKWESSKLCHNVKDSVFTVTDLRHYLYFHLFFYLNPGLGIG